MEMASFRDIVAGIIIISFLTFVSLFGRLPALRKTPIGFLHRLIWKGIPGFLAALDNVVTGGIIVRSGRRATRYLFRENHPLVLIFFVAILSVCEAAFVPAAWPRLSIKHRVAVPTAIALPYLFLYLCIVSTSIITPKNHSEHMRKYPFDYVIFHPGSICRTCQFPKPARSKHCSLCNACVARNDHHCIWLRACVGQNNYHYFLALLLSVSILLSYGSYLGFKLVYDTVQQEYYAGPPGTYWTDDLSWMESLGYMGIAVTEDARIGGIGFFAMLTCPLTSAMLLYHIYLIWAGMTTNESGKWADWRDDIAYSAVYRAKASEIYPPQEEGSPAEPPVSWPVSDDQTLVYTQNGDPPKVGFLLTMDRISVIQPETPEGAADDPRWVKIESLKDVTNIYDRGFIANMRDALGLDP